MKDDELMCLICGRVFENDCRLGCPDCLRRIEMFMAAMLPTQIGGMVIGEEYKSIESTAGWAHHYAVAANEEICKDFLSKKKRGKKKKR